MLAKRKLNSIERKISEAMINNEISREDFMMNSQRSDVGKVSLIEEGKEKQLLMKLLSVMDY